jgi:hypothetical protein
MALKHDNSYWKVDRITKDENMTKLILELIRDNWSKLNEIWISACSVDSFPDMGLNEFGLFCKQIDIYSNNIKASEIDRLFL